MTEIQQEGRIAPNAREDQEEKDTPPAPSADDETEEDETESSPEKKEKDESPDSKKDEEEPAVFQAFHKHPRWIALTQELETLREFKEQVAPLLDQLGKSKPVEENAEIPDWFSELFGDNANAWKKYRAYNVNERKQLRQEILEEIKSESTKASQDAKKWDQWVDKEITNLEVDPDVVAELKKSNVKFNRNEVLKVALDYKPTDDKGNISIRLAYDLWKSLKNQSKPDDKKSLDEKKKLADKTMGKNVGEGERKDYKTSADLAGKSFRDLVPDE